MGLMDEINKVKKEIGKSLTGVGDLPTDIDLLKKIKEMIDGRDTSKKNDPEKKDAPKEKRRLMDKLKKKK